MKKYIALVSFVAALFIGSCSPYTDEEPGGVAVQDMCGTWTVTIEASYAEYLYNRVDPEKYPKVNLQSMSKAELDAIEDWVDVHGVGKTALRTYNTANNDPDSLWFDDDNLWGEKFKIGIDYKNLTFGTEGTDALSGSGCNAVIRYGQILKGAATTPRGVKADSIIAYVFYNDGIGLTYKFSGYRYTGYSADM